MILILINGFDLDNYSEHDPEQHSKGFSQHLE